MQQLVHEDILRDTVSDKGEELPQNEAAQIAARHLTLLMRACQRAGGWDKEKQVYVDLYQQLSHVFGSEDAWKSGTSQLGSIEKWDAKPKGGIADGFGTWEKPKAWTFMDDLADGAAGRGKHKNHLKRSSGTWRLDRSVHLVPGAVMKLRRSFSQRSGASG